MIGGQTNGAPFSEGGWRSPLAALRRRWLILTLLGSLLIVLGCYSLAVWWQPGYAIRWGLVAALILIYETILLWRLLKHNHRPGEKALLPSLGIGNVITVARGWLLALLAGFLCAPRPSGWLEWAPSALYLMAAIADYLDGYLARITQHSTLLGEELDLQYDALGILIAPLLGVLYGQLPIWYLTVGLARYLFMAGTWLLKRRGRPVYNLTPSSARRAMAGFQMGFTAVALWPIFAPPGTWIVATLFMLPFIVGFLRDWLVVSGAIDPYSARYTEGIRRGVEMTTGWLPLGVRALVVPASLWLTAQRWAGNISAGGASWSWQTGKGVFEATAATLVGLGILGRLSSLALLITVGLTVAENHPYPGDLLVIAGATLLTILGTGKLSLWKPEDEFLRRRYGGGHNQIEDGDRD